MKLSLTVTYLPHGLGFLCSLRGSNLLFPTHCLLSKKLVAALNVTGEGGAETTADNNSKTINNYWMGLSMIARIIKAEVCVICRSQRLRRITQTEALIILAIMRKPNPIIVLLCIFLSKCSMCSLNKKYHPLFELLHKTAALAHLQAFLSFEVHLLSFLSNIDEKLSVYIFIIKKEVQVFC